MRLKMILTFDDVTFNFRCGCSGNKVVFIKDTYDKAYRLCPNCYQPNVRLSAQANYRMASYQYACKSCGELVIRVTKWAPKHLLCTVCRRRGPATETHTGDGGMVKCLKPASQKHKCVCPMCRKEYIYSGRTEWATKTKWRYCDICRSQVEEIGDTDGYETDGRTSNTTGKRLTLSGRSV